MATAVKTRWRNLDKKLGAAVLTAADDAFGASARSAIERFDYICPEAIAQPLDARETAACITEARLLGAAFAIRGGGHCGAGSSSTSGLLIDMSRMSALKIRDSKVEAGAGIRTGAMIARIARDHLTLPVGTCPGVGVAGLALAGGIGPLGRLYGFTADRLSGVEVVLADGSVIWCDEQRHGDLFWAMRGGGCGSLGAVTRLEFQAPPLPRSASVVSVSISSEDCLAWLMTWQDWVADGSRRLSVELTLEGQGPACHGHALGVYVGDRNEAASALGHARVRAAIDEMSWPDVMHRLAISSATGAVASGAGASRQGWRVAKSDLFHAPLPREALKRLMDLWRTPTEPHVLRSIELGPWGGAYNDRNPADIAIPHRDVLFSILYSAVAPIDRPDAIALAHAWVDDARQSVRQYAAGGVYQNFRDAAMDAWDQAYFAINLDALRTIKHRYDPDGAFELAGAGTS